MTNKQLMLLLYSLRLQTVNTLSKDEYLLAVFLTLFLTDRKLMAFCSDKFFTTLVVSLNFLSYSCLIFFCLIPAWNSFGFLCQFNALCHFINFYELRDLRQNIFVETSVFCHVYVLIGSYYFLLGRYEIYIQKPYVFCFHIISYWNSIRTVALI